LPGITSAETIIVALQEIDYDVISVRHMTTKGPTSEGGVIHTSLPLFIVNLTKNQKAPEIFKLTTLCDIAMKAKLLTFNVQSAHIGTMIDSSVVTKVHIFMHSGI
jgi:hypothetical protein